MHREMTVGELIAELSTMPEHYPATIVVDGTAGVITGVWCQSIEPGGVGTPHVLIGEREQAPAIVPPEWTGATR